MLALGVFVTARGKILPVANDDLLDKDAHKSNHHD